MKKSLVKVLSMLSLTLFACGEDTDALDDPRDRCDSGEVRLSAQGEVGSNVVDVLLTDPYPGNLENDYFDVILEDGDEPHLIVFDTNRLEDGRSIRTALEIRLRGGAADSDTLEVTSRPEDTPCDPRDGVICAYFGLDTNGDGDLFGVNEVIYPAQAGNSSITFTEVTGNNLSARFSIDFAPLTSGEESGGDVGGSISGCFRYSLLPDGESVF